MLKILEILQELHPEIDFEKEQHLIDDRLLDSLDVFTLVVEISEFYNLYIDIKYVVAKNFNSIQAIQALIEKLLNEQYPTNC